MVLGGGGWFGEVVGGLGGGGWFGAAAAVVSVSACVCVSARTVAEQAELLIPVAKWPWPTRFRRTGWLQVAGWQRETGKKVVE